MSEENKQGEWGMVLDPPIEMRVEEIPAFLKGLAEASIPIESEEPPKNG